MIATRPATSFFAHCRSCHRDTTFTVDSLARPGTFRCGECSTVPAVISCEALGHALDFTADGSAVSCADCDRVIPGAEYEAMMDSTAWTSRPASRRCCPTGYSALD